MHRTTTPGYLTVMHGVPLITTIATSLGLALVFGYLAVRLKAPALFGYLLAGIVLGPRTPGFVADVDLAGQLAEIGVMLLMFGVGLHFTPKDLLAVRKIALPGAVAQIAIATLLGGGLAFLWGWKPGEALVFGLTLSVASTVVLLRALEERDEVGTVNGQIAVGWLVVEDLAMVLVLVLLPGLAGWLGGGSPAQAASGPGVLLSLAITLGKVAVFAALMMLVGRRVFPWLLWRVAGAGSRELFTLCVIAAAVGIAYASSALFGVSFALGAFIAGMVLRESPLSHRAAQDSLPLRDAFSVLFFVSVGMLFDPRVLVDQPGQVLAVLAIILVGKSLAAFAIVLLFRYPLGTALIVSAALAQIGEFSFILAGLARTLGVLSREGQNLVFAGALISIALNPAIFRSIDFLERRIRARRGLVRFLERAQDPLAQLPATVSPRSIDQHVVVVGCGYIGRRIGEALSARGIPFVIAEQNREIVEKLRAGGMHAVAGDASEPGVLVQAHIARARVLVVTIPDLFQVRQVVETARMLRPDVQVAIRARSEEEARLAPGSGRVFVDQVELGTNMVAHVVSAMSRPDP